MADIAKSGTPSLASLLLPANAKHTGLYAGEAIAAMRRVLHQERRQGLALDGHGRERGRGRGRLRGLPAASGEAVTLIFNCTVQYGSGLTPGAGYFLSATGGRLADAASTGGTTVVARAVDTTRIFVKKSY
jgi:hypothetical protein